MGILGRLCLARRIDHAEALSQEVQAWEPARDSTAMKSELAVHHGRRTEKLPSLYASL
jgi:hypothetical protein